MIAEQSGLQQSTITNIINQLIESGLVVETGLIGGKRGRRSIGIRLESGSFQLICVRLSRMNYSIERMDIEGKSESFIHRDFGRDEQADRVLENIVKDTRLLIRTARVKVAAIGVAVPGPYLSKASRFIVISSMSGWENVNIKEALSGQFDIPVYIGHNANAGALAEWWFGKRFPFEKGTFMYLATGYGVGAGIVLDGRSFLGNQGIAGEIGHMSIDRHGDRCVCGNNGCLEMYASVHAVMRYLNSQKEMGKPTTVKNPKDYKEILEAYHSGDALARESIMRSARYLGMGIANLIYCYNPKTIVIGDSLTEAGEEFLEQVKTSVKEHVLPELYEETKIELCSFEQDPALVGAGALALDRILRKPSQLLQED